MIYVSDKITRAMQELAKRAVDLKQSLSKEGKIELANIITSIQRNEEELLIVRYSTI